MRTVECLKLSPLSKKLIMKGYEIGPVSATTLVSADAGTVNSTATGFPPLTQLTFKSSITNRFTGTPVVVVDGTEKETGPHSPAQITASYGKFASAETVGTGFALVLVISTIVAVMPRAARGASAVISNAARKTAPRVVIALRKIFIGPPLRN